MFSVNLGEEIWWDGNLWTNLPFAARFQGKFFRLLSDRNGSPVAALSKESGEAEDEDGLSPNHKIDAAERGCGEEAREMEQIAAMVNLRRLAPVKNEQLRHHYENLTRRCIARRRSRVSGPERSGTGNLSCTN